MWVVRMGRSMSLRGIRARGDTDEEGVQPPVDSSAASTRCASVHEVPPPVQLENSSAQGAWTAGGSSSRTGGHEDSRSGQT